MSYSESVAEGSNQICLAESPNMVKVGKVLPQRIDGLMQLSKSDPLVHIAAEGNGTGGGELHVEIDLKDVSQEVVSYRESVAEVPNQICFAKSPNKVKVGKALAQQVDGLKKLSKSDPIVVITDEENGEHVTAGCDELHVADVSNQICLAKSPNKAKGGKALPKRVDGLKKLSKSDLLVVAEVFADPQVV